MYLYTYTIHTHIIEYPAEPGVWTEYVMHKTWRASPTNSFENRIGLEQIAVLTIDDSLNQQKQIAVPLGNTSELEPYAATSGLKKSGVSAICGLSHGGSTCAYSV